MGIDVDQDQIEYCASSLGNLAVDIQSGGKHMIDHAHETWSQFMLRDRGTWDGGIAVTCVKPYATNQKKGTSLASGGGRNDSACKKPPPPPPPLPTGPPQGDVGADGKRDPATGDDAEVEVTPPPPQPTQLFPAPLRWGRS